MNTLNLNAAPTASAIDTDVQRFTRRCVLVLLIGVLGFFAWAAFAPLGQGVSLAGVVNVQGERKTVTHAIGGVVKSISVREGDRVTKGQVLAHLDPTMAQATVDELGLQRLSWAARLSALGIAVPADGPSDLLSNPFFQTQLRTEQATQYNKAAALHAELSGLQHAIDTAIASIQAIQKGMDAKQDQLALLDARVSKHKSLQASGFMSGNAVADSELQHAAIRVAIQDDVQKISHYRGQVAEARTRTAQLKAQFEAEQQAGIGEAKRQFATLSEQYEKARFERQQTVIYSPVDGFVLGLKLLTEGVAIPAGAHLMDIAPAQGQLEISGMLAPQFRDQVRSGLTVTVRFSALQTAKTLELRGVLGTVGADALPDPKTGHGYYPLKVILDEANQAELKRHYIAPGAPAELLINSGQRTLLSYLLRPLGDKFFHALKEY
ncbi:HlyD family type I secretion periplasmic adaptor subunit [Limnobacter humi]|uniref:Membrane fusion protein (MFP) family protein n=1 Tax=Limnobacter humi TaxID=1778671 RepID=A0ABT1WK12_9BURK|nr:HlyD family type I secretion periplasmic adaptor subunit [Limnobacter humi]MCQ8897097.1 HlyD family type I secretion periplasmic adaptor subunit [Limnobacter humi]